MRASKPHTPRAKAKQAAPSVSNIEPSTRPLMTVDEVIAAWEGEWVLMRVLAFDLRRWPYYGEIVTHAASRSAISDALAKEPRPDPPGSTPYYIFNAFPRTDSGPDYEAAMAQLADQIRDVQRVERARRGR